ncbi:unnamed protein product, partial [Mesorhabditis spiculigera]
MQVYLRTNIDYDPKMEVELIEAVKQQINAYGLQKTKIVWKIKKIGGAFMLIFESDDAELGCTQVEGYIRESALQLDMVSITGSIFELNDDFT